MKKWLKSRLQQVGFIINRVDHSLERDNYSNLDEEKVLAQLVKQTSGCPHFIVDIGASDGISMSNSFLFFRKGWDGVAVECTPEKFPLLANNLRHTKAGLVNAPATPENILPLLRSFNTPKRFGILSLDIDGYDYYVTEQILQEYKPDILCLEINEKIPPPIKFSVKYHKNYFWDASHFYGQSISMLDEMMRRHGYVLAEIHYNNAFYVNPKKVRVKGLSAEQAYGKGYLNKSDRRVRFPWNEDVEYIYSLSTHQQVTAFRKMFSKYKGKYVISA